MASFTSVGDNVELNVPERGENVLVSISGTYNMDIRLQKKVGDGVWKDLPGKTYTTANATVSDYYTTQDFDEKLRLIVITDTSGTATATITDESDKVLHEFGGKGISDPVRVTQGGLDLNGNGLMGAGVVSHTADDTLTEREHAGRMNIFSNAAGDTITLPAATGSGNVYKFFTAITVTSNNNIIQVANATDEFLGNLLQVDTDTSDTLAAYPALDGDGFDTITMNGSTKGGVMGDVIIITDVAAGKFLLEGTILGTGTVASPLSAAVS